MKKPDFNLLLDTRNVELWNKLNSLCTIEVELTTDNAAGLYSKGDYHCIYIPVSKQEPSGFTHELLHIDLDIENTSIPAGFIYLIAGRPNLLKCFSKELIMQLPNMLNHVKMHQKFIQLGFPTNEFISDYDKNKFPIEDAKYIQKGFLKNGIYSSYNIDFYIGKYFSARCCPNINYNYSACYDILRIVDLQLFNILEEFYYKWESYRKETSPFYITPDTMIYDFTVKLDEWCSNKSID